MKRLPVYVAAMLAWMDFGFSQALARSPAKPLHFIDTHVHFQVRKDGDLDKVIDWMDQLHIDRVINHPLSQSRAKNSAEREVMLRNYAKYKDRISHFCIIYPEEIDSVGQAVEILKKEKASGAIGFGEHYGNQVGKDHRDIDDPSCMRLFEACEKVGLPVMFHMDRNKNLDGPGFPRLQHVLKTFPKLILIAHSDWWRRVKQGDCAMVLEKYPNLYADISCSVHRSPIGRDKDFARKFFIKHADKLLFGTDSGWWSFNKPPAAEFEFIQQLDLPQSVLDDICRGNATKLFWSDKHAAR